MKNKLVQEIKRQAKKRGQRVKLVSKTGGKYPAEIYTIK